MAEAPLLRLGPPHRIRPSQLRPTGSPALGDRPGPCRSHPSVPGSDRHGGGLGAIAAGPPPLLWLDEPAMIGTRPGEGPGYVLGAACPEPAAAPSPPCSALAWPSIRPPGHIQLLRRVSHRPESGQAVRSRGRPMSFGQDGLFSSYSDLVSVRVWPVVVFGRAGTADMSHRRSAPTWLDKGSRSARGRSRPGLRTHGPGGTSDEARIADGRRPTAPARRPAPSRSAWPCRRHTRCGDGTG